MEGAEEEDAEVPVVVAVRSAIIDIVIIVIIIISFVLTIVTIMFCIRVAPAAPIPGHMQGPGIAVQVFTFSFNCLI